MALLLVVGLLLVTALIGGLVLKSVVNWFCDGDMRFWQAAVLFFIASLLGLIPSFIGSIISIAFLCIAVWVIVQPDNGITMLLAIIIANFLSNLLIKALLASM